MFVLNRKKITETTTNLSRFEERLEIQKASLSAFFGSALTRFNLNENGDRFYTEGFDYSPFVDIDSYTKNNISALIRIAENDLAILEKQIESEIDTMIEQLKNESKIIENNLDITFETGELFTLDSKIKHLEEREKNLQSIAFPEIELKKIVANALKQQQDMMSDMTTQSKDSNKALAAIIDQKEAFGLGGYLLKSFSSMIHSTGTIRHSFSFPPKRIVINIFYSLCIILAFAEIGFSVPIITGIMKVNIDDSPISTPAWFSAIGITISFAVIQKCLIELVLQRGKIRLYWAATVFMVCVLVILFSYADSEDTFTVWQFIKINNKGFLLGFFSISFALANAFLFREVSYLHHLQHRLYDGSSLEMLRKNRVECYRLWQEKQLHCQNLTVKYEIQKASIHSKVVPEISDRLKKLEQLFIARFKEGQLSRTEYISKHNSELEVGLIRKYIAICSEGNNYNQQNI